MAKMTSHHKQMTELKKASVAFWQKHPLSLAERLKQFRRLREQRLARESKLMNSANLQ